MALNVETWLASVHPTLRVADRKDPLIIGKKRSCSDDIFPENPEAS